MPRNDQAKATTILKAGVIRMLASILTGFLGICHLTGKRMYLTTGAATYAAALEAIRMVAEDGATPEDAARFVAANYTADVDGAHTPESRVNGGHTIVLTDGPAQRAFGDGDTPDAPADTLRQDDRDTRGYARDRAFLQEVRRNLPG